MRPTSNTKVRHSLEKETTTQEKREKDADQETPHVFLLSPPADSWLSCTALQVPLLCLDTGRCPRTPPPLACDPLRTAVAVAAVVFSFCCYYPALPFTGSGGRVKRNATFCSDAHQRTQKNSCGVQNTLSSKKK